MFQMTFEHVPYEPPFYTKSKANNKKNIGNFWGKIICCSAQDVGLLSLLPFFEFPSLFFFWVGLQALVITILGRFGKKMGTTLICRKNGDLQLYICPADRASWTMRGCILLEQMIGRMYCRDGQAKIFFIISMYEGFEMEVPHIIIMNYQGLDFFKCICQWPSYTTYHFISPFILKVSVLTYFRVKSI